MKKILLSASAVFLIGNSFAQNISVIQEQSQHYSSLGVHDDQYWDQLRYSEGAPVTTNQNVSPQSVCNLNKRVFGWHPYWVGSVYSNYQWNLLSDLCYFDYTVSPNTGNNTNGSFAWSTSAAVTAAISNGVNADICATMFSSHSTFFASSSAQQTFITNIISLLQSRGGHGVNIDFEGMGSSNTAGFTAFMQNLSNQLHAAIPGSEVSVALYSVDWSGVFDIPNLTPYVDLFVIMGYDYYYGGSTTAGPEDPLYNFQTTYNYTLSKSITYYRKQGVPAAKLLLGLPYYGREWETTGLTAPSATTGAYTATKTFNVVKANVNGYYSNSQWEANSFSPFYPYVYLGNDRQCWCDNSWSMRRRFDVVNQYGIGGIGIWALGYDDGYSDFWDAIRDKFSDCATIPCSDTLWDMGGPTRNYYDAENYTTTISPTGASSVSLAFSQFDVELNYDSLFLYDGPSTISPLIGAYTGTNSPGTVTSTGPSLTLRFKSDNNTNRPGFTAIWNCIADNISPTTQIVTPPGWITQDFNATFNDADNSGGSGLDKSFYQVCGYNGTEWRSNDAAGFFNDDFDQQTINPQWTGVTGIWNANATGQLEQSDETNSNTNIYAPLTENLSNRYLYHWQGMISGTGNNRRAGLHFFCDNPTLPNRGNNYFVWFRVDQSQLQFYKTTNDVFSLMYTVPMTVNAGQWYDWKVTYDRITGEITVYQDDVFIGSWTDPSPIATGDYISFRSGNCNWQVDNFQVYRSRYSNTQTLITVGNCASCDMQNENVDPATPGGRIRSINNDNAHNISTIAQQDVNVDWTAPVMPGIILDGTAADIDTTFNLAQLQANWAAAADTNSGVMNYDFAVGTTSGDSDVVMWTNNGNLISVTTPVSLTAGQWYYFSVRATNNALLTSVHVQSDGQVAMLSTGIFAGENVNCNIYPNPSSGIFYLDVNAANEFSGTIDITDISGRVIFSSDVKIVNGGSAILPLDLSLFAAGTYFATLHSEKFSKTMELIRH
ncbi:MAG: T9SS type A sorting domain-containing protein [Bacteroidetes bacterium]|nr:T9SS type A sorting domain-containing protein [Bacteroidota bacterium]